MASTEQQLTTSQEEPYSELASAESNTASNAQHMITTSPYAHKRRKKSHLL